MWIHRSQSVIYGVGRSDTHAFEQTFELQMNGPDCKGSEVAGALDCGQGPEGMLPWRLFLLFIMYYRMRKPIHTSSGDHPVSLGQHALPSDRLIQRYHDTYLGSHSRQLLNFAQVKHMILPTITCLRSVALTSLLPLSILLLATQDEKPNISSATEILCREPIPILPNTSDHAILPVYEISAPKTRA